MNVLFFTIFISLLLSVVFLICFINEALKANKSAGVERDSLLPLSDSHVESKQAKHNK